MKLLRLLALVTAAVAPAAVGAMPATASAAVRSAPTSSALASASSARHQYLVDSAPVEKASDAFEATALSWLSSPVTSSKAKADALPLISALVTFEKELGSQTWPAGARADIRALVSAFSGLLVDLRGLSHDKIANAASWEGPLLHADVVTSAANNKVRHDLGLAPITVAV
jgi:hypothetical protein